MLNKKKTICSNRSARFHYYIEDEFEAGLCLKGSEVKSLRIGKATISESYINFEGGVISLINAHIPEYVAANRFTHEPNRTRTLLLHKKEIEKLRKAIERDGMTIIATELFFNEKNVAKLKINLVKGKKLHDKRDATKERDWNRDKARLMKQKD